MSTKSASVNWDKGFITPATDTCTSSTAGGTIDCCSGGSGIAIEESCKAEDGEKGSGEEETSSNLRLAEAEIEADEEEEVGGGGRARETELAEYKEEVKDEEEEGVKTGGRAREAEESGVWRGCEITGGRGIEEEEDEANCPGCNESSKTSSSLLALKGP